MKRFLITVISFLTLMTIATSLNAQEAFIKQTIEDRLREGDCATAEQLYKAWGSADKNIERQIAKCKKDKVEKKETEDYTECKFINIGEFGFKRTVTENKYREPSQKEIVDSIRKQYPDIDKKYYYLGIKPGKHGVVDVESHRGGLVGSYITREIITPDHKANMRNALERMIPRIPKGSIISIDSVEMTLSSDYMTAKDYRDEMTSLLLNAGYRVSNGRSTIQGNESTDCYIMNISTRDNALKIMVLDSKTSEIVCLEIVRYDGFFVRHQGIFVKIICNDKFDNVIKR